MKIVFLGGGNMANALIGGMVKQGFAATDIDVIDLGADARAKLTASYGVTCHASADTAPTAPDVLVLAVKPQQMKEAVAPLVGKLGKALVISIAAGLDMAALSRWLGGHRTIVRCMPNTPALIGAGATGLCANARVSPPQRAQAQHILDAAGLTRWVDDEALMDTVTGISGSAPAYFFALVEALEDAAVAQGMDRGTARALAAQTCLGAGRMLVESGEAPGELRRRVTSPNGTTQAALESFAADGLPAIVAHAVAAATRRGGELAAELDKT